MVQVAVHGGEYQSRGEQCHWDGPLVCRGCPWPGQISPVESFCVEPGVHLKTRGLHGEPIREVKRWEWGGAGVAVPQAPAPPASPARCRSPARCWAQGTVPRTSSRGPPGHVPSRSCRKHGYPMGCGKRKRRLRQSVPVGFQWRRAEE